MIFYFIIFLFFEVWGLSFKSYGSFKHYNLLGLFIFAGLILYLPC